MLPLIRTLFDITLLRKGPEHIPRSGILLIFAIVLWLLSVLVQIVLIDRRGEENLGYDMMSALLAVVSLSAILVGFGRGERLVQTVTAALGCSALLINILTVGRLVALLIGSTGLMSLLVWTYLLWAIAVRGHIIARAIDQHWYLGLIFAVLIFVLQYVAVIYVR